jgi:hypothetical protein
LHVQVDLVRLPITPGNTVLMLLTTICGAGFGVLLTFLWAK